MVMIMEYPEPEPRKILPIIYVIDTSGSMAGTRISAVNQAMNETMAVLKEVSEKNPGAEIRVGVLEFSTGAKWVTNENELISMDDFYWNDLSAAGVTDLGAALNELYDKMSRKALFNSEVGYKVPVLIFMSDGYPGDDWETSLTNVSQNNRWFLNSIKICIAIDDESDVDVLATVAGSGDKRRGSKSVIKVTDVAALKKLIKVVSVCVAKKGEIARTDSNDLRFLMKRIRESMKDEDGISFPDEPKPEETGFNGWDEDSDYWY